MPLRLDVKQQKKHVCLEGSSKMSVHAMPCHANK